MPLLDSAAVGLTLHFRELGVSRAICRSMAMTASLDVVLKSTNML